MEASPTIRGESVLGFKNDYKMMKVNRKTKLQCIQKHTWVTGLWRKEVISVGAAGFSRGIHAGASDLAALHNSLWGMWT